MLIFSFTVNIEQNICQTLRTRVYVKLFWSVIVCLFLLVPPRTYSQCTPVNCLDSLPAYGGICKTSHTDGRINQSYSDFISFHITNTCLDIGILDSTYKGFYAKMLKLHSFTFSGLPAGLTVSSNQTEYSAPANGCAGISGTPTEAGLFKVNLHALVNIRTWPLSNICSGIVTLDLNDQPFDGSFSLRILPDANFTISDSVFCLTDPPVLLTPTGNQGGIFSGPGVSGNTFNPALAGTGIHIIRYDVSAQQGTAISPTTNNALKTVTVTTEKTWYADNDGDSYGNPDVSRLNCGKPAGFVANNLDCSDSNMNIHPGATDLPDNGIDEDCNGMDSKASSSPVISENPFKIYPNPASDFVIIENPSNVKGLSFRIYSAQGLLLLNGKMTDFRVEVDIRNFVNGFYFLKVTDDSHSTTVRIVKQ
jgi:hypothetical protein